MPRDVLLAITTFPDAGAARECVQDLVERRLVACGNVLPGATSIYRWQGGVERSEEVVVLLKLTAQTWDACAARLVEMHPYEVPELIAVPVTLGHPPYLAWVADGVGAS